MKKAWGVLRDEGAPSILRADAEQIAFDGNDPIPGGMLSR